MADYVITAVNIMGEQVADIAITGEVISEIGHNLDTAGATVVAGQSLIALPGLVDIHTHLREPGREDAETVETGTRAAARGGYTAVFEIGRAHV